MGSSPTAPIEEALNGDVRGFFYAYFYGVSRVFASESGRGEVKLAADLRAERPKRRFVIFLTFSLFFLKKSCERPHETAGQKNRGSF